MKATPLFTLLVLVTSLTSARAGASSQGLPLLGLGYEVEVITNGDVYPAGRSVPRAAPGQPLYYLPVSTGYRDFGAGVAGEKIPPADQVLHIIARTLESQGYRIADAGHAPQMVIGYAWGTLNAERISWNPDWPAAVLNRGQILRFLGGEKMGLQLDRPIFHDSEIPIGLSTHSPRARDFHERGSDSYSIIALCAMDVSTLREHRVERLWTTRIACRSRGHDLSEVIPTMLSIAAPQIGRQTTRPVIVQADERYRPNFGYGEPRILASDVPNPTGR